MSPGTSSDVIHKEVVIIGNGPSGIALSYMLSGNLPYIKSEDHPDEMLSARLSGTAGQCLVNQDFRHLSVGLEGRSTNPVSLLLDALLHPCADIGLEMDPLLEFRRNGAEIDHVVLGKGPPGGSWHRMDPYVLTLSLGSWMSLPGLPFLSRDSGEKRAYAYNVANYYVQYVREMGLTNNFNNNVSVTNIKPPMRTRTERRISQISEMSVDSTNSATIYYPRRMSEDMLPLYKQPQENEHLLAPPSSVQNTKHVCHLTIAFNYLLRHGKGNNKPRKSCCSKRSSFCSKRSSNSNNNNSKPCDSSRTRSISLSSCDSNDNFINSSTTSPRTVSDRVDMQRTARVPFRINLNCDKEAGSNWMVEAHNVESGETTTYSCRYLVLANGASDLPNRLDFTKIDRDPDWLFHDLRSLELHLDRYMEDKNPEDVEPVLVVGAGLSAADAVVASRGRNVPVVHVFRNKSADLNKQLPENMYPEYHKVHQMMQDGGSTYPYYSAYPGYNLSEIDETSHSVILTSQSGDRFKLQVSFVAVLIGSRPDLNFLPPGMDLGVRKDLPIDCKTNTLDINKLTHQVEGFDNLFAVGPLAGDNFVRFIPGGALAMVSELYRRNNYNF